MTDEQILVAYAEAEALKNNAQHTLMIIQRDYPGQTALVAALQEVVAEVIAIQAQLLAALKANP